MNNHATSRPIKGLRANVGYYFASFSSAPDIDSCKISRAKSWKTTTRSQKWKIERGECAFSAGNDAGCLYLLGDLVAILSGIDPREHLSYYQHAIRNSRRPW
jgi:hypothetical protein